MTLEALGGFSTVRFLAVGLFAGILLALEIGRWLGRRRLAADPEAAKAGLGAVEGSVFGLLGLLVAFTFSGAASRYDALRTLVVEEANDISTAYSRIDMLPASAQPPLRDLFRRYVDTRLEIYRSLPDLDAARDALARSNALQGEIWAAATAACRTEDGQRVAILILQPLNVMFDVTTTRTMAFLHHPPIVIYGMLFVLILVCAVLAGYGMAGSARRSWTHMLGFATMMAVAVYVILEIEYPHYGFVRIDAVDRVIERVRASMDDG